VLVARIVTDRTGDEVAFEEVWERRQTVALSGGIDVQLPAVEDLIRTKRFALRAKDLEDIRMLEIYKAGGPA
jgi:predicted nucleotidyltransferase